MPIYCSCACDSVIIVSNNTVLSIIRDIGLHIGFKFTRYIALWAERTDNKPTKHKILARTVGSSTSQLSGILPYELRELEDVRVEVNDGCVIERDREARFRPPLDR